MKPDEAVIDVQAERFHDPAHPVGLGHGIGPERRPIDMRPADGGVIEAERAHGRFAPRLRAAGGLQDVECRNSSTARRDRCSYSALP